MYIETQHLLIRPFSPPDFDALYSIYNSKEIMLFISDSKCIWTKAEIMDKHNKINLYSNKQFGTFAVIHKETDSTIGEAGLFNSFGDISHLELGYIIDKHYWNNGLGTEICKALINYCFNVLSVQKLTARMYSANKASVRLSEKCGMVKVDNGFTKDFKEYCVFEITKSKYCYLT